MKSQDNLIKVVILQKYITPYRVNLFNYLNDFKEIDVLLTYYGKFENTRRWTEFPDQKCKYYFCKVLSIRLNYERNINIPFVFSNYLYNYKPKAIICFADFAGFFALLWKFFFNAKLIVWSESTKESEYNVTFIKKIWRKYFFSKADCFILPGKKAVEYINEFIANPQIFLAFNSVDEIFEISESELCEKFNDVSNLKIVYAGNLTRTKGTDILLESLELLSKKELNRKYEVFVLGEGTEKKRNIPNVSYLGFKQVSEYSEYLKLSHVVVIPSREDRNPLIMIEALKSGNIILCSKYVGNHPEAVDYNGMVLEELNPEMLCKALETFLNYTRDDLYRMGLRSREKSKSFSHKNSAESFRKAIEYAAINNLSLS